MIGEKIGKYTVLEIVGSGSMGTVYKAEDPEGQLVAVKVVRSQVLSSMEKRERFLRCLLVASELRHKGICPILDIGDDDDAFFVIMPLIQGQTLEQYMGRKPIPLPQALEIALSIGAALEAIHDAGAAHRGLKPTNIWIPNNSERSVLLSDCCVARFTEIAKPRRSRASTQCVDFADTLIPLGALAYMSPEQVRGEPVDYRTDIFSFGVVLYEMVSGRHPFDARTSLSRISAILEAEPIPLPSKRTSLPTPLVSILHKALAKNREKRYQTMSEFLADIQTVRQSALTAPRPRSLVSAFQKWLSSQFGRTLRN
jgi:serine/threonine protein kinase